MWNYALGALLCGATLCLYDGAATYPKEDAQWKFAADHQIEHFGHGAPFISIVRKRTGRNFLYGSKNHWFYRSAFVERSLSMVAAAIPKSTYHFLRGTDVCTAFLGGNPLEPVYAGKLQAPMLEPLSKLGTAKAIA